MGRAIFNDAINSVLRTHGQESLSYFNEIVDRAGLKKIVAGLIRRFGNEDTAQVLDAIKRLGFRYATQSGTTIAISDITMPTDKASILKIADDEVQRIERDYRRGLITDDERYNEVIEVWTKAKDHVTKAVSSVLDPFGPVAMMAQSGAKGNIQQISQMSGMRGLMADPSGRIIELPIRSSFRDGLTVLEYFLSTHGARKGLADTAIRTADSGYLTRRLIDVSQNVIVYEDDCGTELGIWIYDLVEPARRDLRLAQLPGRVLAKDLVDEATGEIVAERNTVIDEQIRDHIAAARELPQMYLRSPLTCEARHGICQLCYGWHLGTRRMVAGRRRGRHRRGAVHRRARHAADHAYVPHGRRRGYRHHLGPAARRGAVRGPRAQGQGHPGRARRRRRAAAHRRQPHHQSHLAPDVP